MQLLDGTVLSIVVGMGLSLLLLLLSAFLYLLEKAYGLHPQISPRRIFLSIVGRVLVWVMCLLVVADLISLLP